MAETTPNLGLKKPVENEHADVAVINSNMDKIDQTLGDMASVPTTAKDAAGAISELFTNVSDGKALIASAITDKGVPTDANDSFAEMAGNIEGIHVGPDTSDATATAGDILASKTAYGAAGTKLTGMLSLTGNADDSDVLITKTYYASDAKTKRIGSMVNRGSITITPSSSDQIIPAGYHNGGGKVSGVVVPAANVLTGTTIAGTTGTMINRGAMKIVPGATSISIPQGYHNGVGTVEPISTLPIYLSAPTVRFGGSSTPNVWFRIKKVTVQISGVIRISFALQSSSNGSVVYGRIYKNGVPSGAVRSTSSGFSSNVFTEDFTCSINDYFELYLMSPYSNTNAVGSDLNVQLALQSPTNGTIDID